MDKISTVRALIHKNVSCKQIASISIFIQIELFKVIKKRKLNVYEVLIMLFKFIST